MSLFLLPYNFSSSNVFLLIFRDKYNEILMQKWSGVFDGIFNDDNYTPIYVTDAEECAAIMDGFPLRGEADNDKVHLYYTCTSFTYCNIKNSQTVAMERYI